MPRIGAILIGFCIAIVAASASLLLYVHAGFSAGEAAAAGLGITLLMTVMHVNAAGGRERRQMRLELDHLYSVNDTLTQELDDLRGELAGLQTLGSDVEAVRLDIEASALETVDLRIGYHVAAVKESLAGEMRTIETLVKQLAEEVARPRRAQAAGGHGADGQNSDEDGGGRRAPRPDTPLGHLDDAIVLAMVRQAIEDNRVDVYFQPVVTLPQRKVRYYEALTRLRADDGEIIMPADYLRVAEPAGIMPLIDNLLLFRTVQVVRRLTARNRSVGVFCNISTHSLVDPDFFPQFMEFLEHNKLMASSIFFEFSQATVAEAGPIETESLAALQEQGFRFSMDKVSNLDINAQDLARRGFKFVRVEADRLLNGAVRSGTHIHPADLSKLLARQGIELIAEKIEHETTVVNLLDYDVPLAQGFLFAEPRPVRGDFGNDLPELKPALKAG